MRKESLLSLMLLAVFLIPLSLQSQVLTGKVSSEGNALVGATIVVRGTTRGTNTDADGKYTLRLDPGTYEVTFSMIGYATRTLRVPLKANEERVLNVELQAQAVELADVVVVGARADSRTVIDSPLPLDVVGVASIVSTGQATFDKALQVKIPSFSTANTPVNDATSLLDPYEIRNLGASRTLLLVNGKRKNFSSLVNIQSNVGRGETGADLAAIPMAAIKKVELLRDGASALYGSDAIAGVMNIILKDKVDYTALNLQSGITSKGDGGFRAIDLNTGTSLKGGGFLNYTIAFQDQSQSQRGGSIDPVADAATLTGNSAADLAAVRAFLSRFPDGRNLSGTPASTTGNFEINASLPVGESGEIYGNAAYVVKRVLSHANYRQPYWKKDPNYLLHRPGEEYLGYHPTFQGDLDDYNGTIGYKTKKNEWKVDVSVTLGGNKQLYTVEGTQNFALGANSPINFKPGGYGFSHLVGNVDVSKSLSKTFNVAIGSEVRREEFQIFAGDTASYSGSGANSFPGIRAENAIVADRFNLGAYLDMAWDVSEQLLLNGALRAETYSDFGDAFVWKLSGRYKPSGELFVLRASASTGFRAPSLHQIYTQINQNSFSGGTIVTSGLLSNVSRAVATLGVERLKAEKSVNLTTGIGFNPTSKISLALDYYNIQLKDRVVLSSRLHGPGTGSKLDSLLAATGATEVAFFINGVDTRTQGVDVVANIKDLGVWEDVIFNVNLAGNYNSSVREGSVHTPDPIAKAGGTIFNRTEEGYLLTCRPKYKGTLGLEWEWSKWNVNLLNTLFGPATFVNADLPDGDKPVDDPKSDSYARLVFDTKVVTDLVVSYRFTETVALHVAVNNILNVLPHYHLENIPTGRTEQSIRNDVDFNGRYNITSYDGSHFSFNGTTFLATVNVNF